MSTEQKTTVARVVMPDNMSGRVASPYFTVEFLTRSQGLPKQSKVGMNFCFPMERSLVSPNDVAQIHAIVLRSVEEIMDTTAFGPRQWYAKPLSCEWLCEADRDLLHQLGYSYFHSAPGLGDRLLMHVRTRFGDSEQNLPLAHVVQWAGLLFLVVPMLQPYRQSWSKRADKLIDRKLQSTFEDVVQTMVASREFGELSSLFVADDLKLILDGNPYRGIFGNKSVIEISDGGKYLRLEPHLASALQSLYPLHFKIEGFEDV